MASIDRYIDDIDQTLLLLKNTKGIPQDVRNNVNEMATNVKKKLDASRETVKKEVAQIKDGKFNMEESSGRKFEQAERQYEKLMKELRDIISNANRSIIREVQIEEIDNYIYTGKTDEKLVSKVKEYEDKLSTLASEIQSLYDQISKLTSENKSLESKIASVAPVGVPVAPAAFAAVAASPVPPAPPVAPVAPVALPVPPVASPAAPAAFAAPPVPPVASPAAPAAPPAPPVGPPVQEVGLGVARPIENKLVVDINFVQTIVNHFNVFRKQMTNSYDEWTNELKILENRSRWQNDQMKHIVNLLKAKLNKLNDIIFQRNAKITELTNARNKLLELQTDDSKKIETKHYISELERENRWITESHKELKQRHEKYLIEWSASFSRIDELEQKLKDAERLAETRRLTDAKRAQIAEDYVKSKNWEIFEGNLGETLDKFIVAARKQVEIIKNLRQENENTAQILQSFVGLLGNFESIEQRINRQNEILDELATIGGPEVIAAAKKIKELQNQLDDTKAEMSAQERASSQVSQKMANIKEAHAAELKNTILELEKQYQEYAEQLRGRYSKYERMSTEAENLKAQIQMLEEKNQTLNKEKEIYTTENTKLQFKLKELEGKILSLQDDLIKAQDQNIDYKRKARKEKQVIKPPGESQSLEEKKREQEKAEFNQRIVILVERNKELQKELQNLREQIAALEKKRGPQQDTMPPLAFAPSVDSECLECKKRIAELEDLMKMQNVIISTLEGRVEEGKSQINQLEETNVRVNNAYGNAQNQLMALSRMLQEKRAEYDSLFDKYQNLLVVLGNVQKVAVGEPKSGGNPNDLSFYKQIIDLYEKFQPKDPNTVESNEAGVNAAERKILSSNESTFASLKSFVTKYYNSFKQIRENTEDFNEIANFIRMQNSDMMDIMSKLLHQKTISSNFNISAKEFHEQIKQLQKQLQLWFSNETQISPSDYLNNQYIYLLLGYIQDCNQNHKKLLSFGNGVGFFRTNYTRGITDTIKTLFNLVIQSKIRLTTMGSKMGGNPSMLTGMVAITSIGSQVGLAMLLFAVLILVIIFLCYLIYESKTEIQPSYIIKYYPHVETSA